MSPRRRLIVSTLLSTTLAFALTGCGDNGSAASDNSDDGGPQADLAGDWHLVSGTVAGNQLELQPDYPVTLSADSNLEVGGQSGCNHYGAKADVRGAELSFSDVGSTAMGCAEPVLNLEASYLSALGDVTAYEQTPDRLVLTGAGVELTFEPLPPVPTEELVDTVWQLQTIVTGDVALSVTGEPTLQLRSDGAFEMTSGCDLVLTGEWVEHNGAVTFTSSAASGGCRQHPQSQAILSVSDSFSAEITGNQLTVTGRHGGELVYLARWTSTTGASRSSMTSPRSV